MDVYFMLSNSEDTEEKKVKSKKVLSASNSDSSSDEESSSDSSTQTDSESDSDLRKSASASLTYKVHSLVLYMYASSLCILNCLYDVYCRSMFSHNLSWWSESFIFYLEILCKTFIGN